MDGILNVIKPPGVSSHQMVSACRRLLRTKKIGHTGTLDPGAAGVLTLCIGRATKIVSYLTEKDKRYIAELTLGVSTDTQDASGITTEMHTDFAIDPKELGTVLHSFRGAIEQLPPMTSAIRVDGQRLYKAARAGLEIERPTRHIQIHDLHINKIWPEEYPELVFGSRVLLDVHCSKGTYVRTLCHDIGAALGCGGHMSFLSRIRNGSFSLQDCHSWETLESMTAEQDFSFLLPIEQGLPDWTRVIVSPLAEERISHGGSVPVDQLLSVPRILVPGDEVLVMDLEGQILALAAIEHKEQLVCQPFRVLKG